MLFRSLGERAHLARIALEVAAALGPEVDEGEWGAACAAAGVVVPSGLVERLVSERLVAPVERDEEELIWAFSHGMLRESVERGAAEAGRAPGHHRAIATMLQARSGRGGQAERIGRHLLAAQSWSEALTWLMQAARDRSRRGEFRAGYALLVAREEALRGLGAAPSDPRWGEGRLLLAWLHLRQGQPVPAGQRAAALLSDARRHGWTGLLAEGLLLSAEVARIRGAPSRALELYTQARMLFERSGDDRGVSACTLGLGALALQIGEYARAGRLLQQAQVGLTRAGEDRRLADCLRLRAEAARRGGAYDAAEALVTECQAIFGRLCNRVGQAEAMFTRAEIARSRGAREEAVSGYRAALRTLEAAGSEDLGLVLVRLGVVLTGAGRATDARTVLEAARQQAERQENPGLLGLVLAALVPVDAARGAWAELDQHLSRAGALLASTDLVDADVVEAMEHAARLCPEPERRGAILALAAQQRAGLG